MLVASWNVNSLRSTEQEFLGFLEDFKPDIVMLQEVRAYPDQLSFFLTRIPGYEAIFNPSEKPGYSGSAMYYKTSLKPKQVTNTTGSQMLDSEGRVNFMHLNNTLIFNFYTPNGNASEERLKYKLKFYNEILVLMKEKIGQVDSIILGGDLNLAPTELDLYAPEKNKKHSGFLPEEKQWFQELEKLGFVDTFRLFEKKGGYYTWWHMRDPKREQNKGWRFDYLLVTEHLKKKVKKSEILRNVFGSDHCPILLEVEI